MKKTRKCEICGRVGQRRFCHACRIWLRRLTEK